MEYSRAVFGSQYQRSEVAVNMGKCEHRQVYIFNRRLNRSRQSDFASSFIEIPTAFSCTPGYQETISLETHIQGNRRSSSSGLFVVQLRLCLLRTAHDDTMASRRFC